ncbi:MAG: Transposase [Bacteroidetes bacterium 38_7]|nr:MAG: Transposase [Bacteroidetes bacterium 38_7]HAL64987.1 hypothetical protein [Bacteroidales bacterium]
METNGYEYILGARIKNEREEIKEKILAMEFSDGMTVSIEKSGNTRLIVNYSASRAKKDAYNRKRGLARLEKQIKSGKLTKSHINNRGYNKYLTLSGDVVIEIDYEKYNNDGRWDGIKGYLTNTKQTKSILLNMDEEQAELYRMVCKNFQGVPLREIRKES